MFRSIQSCRLLYEKGALVLITPYNQSLVRAVKSLPYLDRKWDNNRKAWLIDPKHEEKIISWVDVYAGEKVSSPYPSSGYTSGVKTAQILTLKYLGAVKEREDGTKSAFGLVDGEWKAVFSESVLRLWFEGVDVVDSFSVSAPSTYYALLGIKKTASNDEVKTAFRRMALQWHPDHCKEPDAHEMFIKIKEAYDILSDSGKRARYDHGLALDAMFEDERKRQEKLQKMIENISVYRAPLRCGILLVEGILKLGRIEITQILGWQDIINDKGETLVVSWNADDKEIIEEWI